MGPPGSGHGLGEERATTGQEPGPRGSGAKQPPPRRVPAPGASPSSPHACAGPPSCQRGLRWPEPWVGFGHRDTVTWDVRPADVLSAGFLPGPLQAAQGQHKERPSPLPWAPGFPGDQARAKPLPSVQMMGGWHPPCSPSDAVAVPDSWPGDMCLHQARGWHRHQLTPSQYMMWPGSCLKEAWSSVGTARHASPVTSWCGESLAGPRRSWQHLLPCGVPPSPHIAKPPGSLQGDAEGGRHTF